MKKIEIGMSYVKLWVIALFISKNLKTFSLLQNSTLNVIVKLY